MEILFLTTDREELIHRLTQILFGSLKKQHGHL